MLGRGERHRVSFVARTSRARFRDPAVAAATTRDDVPAARRMSVVKATDVRQARRIAEYLDPWTDPRVARSWLALAGAAENRYTQEMLMLQSRIEASWCGARMSHFRRSTCRTLRAEDPRNSAGFDQAGRRSSDGDPKAVAGALAEFFVAER
jgi:hypothetical protein